MINIIRIRPRTLAARIAWLLTGHTIAVVVCAFGVFWWGAKSHQALIAAFSQEVVEISLIGDLRVAVRRSERTTERYIASGDLAWLGLRQEVARDARGSRFSFNLEIVPDPG